MKLWKFETILLFISNSAIEISILHSPPIDKQTFTLQSNFVESSSKFEFCFQMANQTRESDLEVPISNLIPNSFYFRVPNGALGFIV